MALKSIKPKLINPILSRVLTKPSTKSSTHSAPICQDRPFSLACRANLSKESLTVTWANLSKRSKPSSAIFRRVDCTSNGIAETAITIAPDSLACRANSCAAPVPVPPPRPVNKITNSTGSISLLTTDETLLIRCSASGGNEAQPSLSTTVPKRKT